MSLQIDYKFISQLEGGQILKGYVPLPQRSKSGVTIATGFDLGQRNQADLKKLNLPASLITKLTPYLGLKQQQAQKALNTSPLTISILEASLIDKAVKAEHVGTLTLKYNAATPLKTKKSASSNKPIQTKATFRSLPKQAQTVIASVSFQYGVNLQSRTPKFWKAVTNENWKAAIKILKNFGDIYSTRRNKEAALLGTI